MSLYFLLRRKSLQNYMLLGAGLYFYGSWDHRFLFLLLLSSLVDFLGGMGIVGEWPRRRNLLLLFLGIAVSGFLLCAPIDWQALYCLVLPRQAFDGGWMEPVAYTGLFLAAGDWHIVSGALGALGVLGLAVILGQWLNPAVQPKYFLVVSMVNNLVLLGFFKYFDFLMSGVEKATEAAGLGQHHWQLGILVPAGISFYTFQSMSYAIDIYRREMKPTHNFFNFLLFISFFPHLVAGPIQRAIVLLPQLERARTFDWTRFQSGIYLIGWGLFKKIFIADNLTRLVEPIYAVDANIVGPQVLFATYAFAFQIYSDFSAYSDIARGTSRLLGVELTLNFNLPYIATNPRDFWRRWHISLSTWLREYLYISLGGNRGGALCVYRNLMITMVLGGLWHGARMNFIYWGIFHGVLLCLHRLIEPALKHYTPKSKTGQSLYSMFCWAIFFHLLCYSWLLFRAQTHEQVGALTAALWSGWADTGDYLGMLARLLWFCGPLLIIQVFQVRTDNLLAPLCWPWPVRTAFYVIIFYLTIVFGVFGAQEFIYFQF